jgi:hypothetical protein
LLYFCRGSLPWQGLQAATKTAKYEISNSKTTNNCDDAHNFKEFESSVNDKQLLLYNDGINPKVTKISVNITKTGGVYKTEWSATIEKSSDGKAWMGFGSRGSCNAGFDKRADAQWNGTTDENIVTKKSPCYAKSFKQCLIDSAGALEFSDFPVYLNSTLYFKQYFVQFTKSKYPAK